MVEGSDTNFYGTTTYGGTDGYGTVFRISPGGSETNLYSFTGTPDGQYIQCRLVEGSDGNIYGTTDNGGEDGDGTVFRMEVGLPISPPPPAPPAFQSVTLSNGTLNLTWNAASGATYQLQYNSNLTSRNWIILRSNLTTTAGTLIVTDTLTNLAERFYRLVLSK